MVDRPLRLTLAVLSGILLALAFPKFGMGLLSLVALVPLLVALHLPGSGKERAVSPGRAFRLGYVTGAVFFLVLLYWIPDLPRENLTVPFVMYPALAIMVLYLALFPALASLGAAWMARRGVPLGLTFPFLWTLAEAVRGTGPLGFPWGSLGYALAPYPHLIQFASITGIWGVTLWAALVSGLIHLYLELPWVRPKLIGFALLVAVVITPYFHGREVLGRRQPRAGVEVGLVQSDVGANKWELAVRDSVAEALLDQTARLMEGRRPEPPALVIWPETAMPARLPREPHYQDRVESLVDSTGIPLLAGFPDGYRLPDGGVRWTNSAALYLPHRGLVQQYDKRHLVPFSEDFPLPFLNRFDFGQSDFSSGTRPGVFKEISPPFGVLICFESIFPGLARGLARDGARYLVNITNDQWFGNSAAPFQHFEMNVLRAIENRMGLARAANTGISAVIDPYGIVVDRTTTFVKASVIDTVELGRELTFYTRHGDWILWLALAAVLAEAGWALVRGRRP